MVQLNNSTKILAGFYIPRSIVKDRTWTTVEGCISMVLENLVLRTYMIGTVVFPWSPNGRPPQDTSQPVRPGYATTASIASPTANKITGGLPAGGHVYWLSGWGVPQKGYQSPQPMAEVYARTREGYNNYPKLGHIPPPPVLEVWYVCVKLCGDSCILIGSVNLIG